MNRLLAVLGAVLAAAVAITAVAVAAKGPDRIALPDGYRPEGIAAGKGKSIYVGSIPTGRVLQINTTSGASREAVPARDGHAAIGLKYAKRDDRRSRAGGHVAQVHQPEGAPALDRRLEHPQVCRGPRRGPRKTCGGSTRRSGAGATSGW